jgi:hypothetical protein
MVGKRRQKNTNWRRRNIAVSEKERGYLVIWKAQREIRRFSRQHCGRKRVLCWQERGKCGQKRNKRAQTHGFKTTSNPL